MMGRLSHELLHGPESTFADALLREPLPDPVFQRGSFGLNNLESHARMADRVLFLGITPTKFEVLAGFESLVSNPGTGSGVSHPAWTVRIYIETIRIGGSMSTAPATDR